MQITRGFHGRRRENVDPSRVPPGQYLTDDFPGALGRPDPARRARPLDLHDPRGGRAAALLDVGGVPGAAA